jgi:serine/threonine-protein kinase
MAGNVSDEAFARYVNQIGAATVEQIEAAKAVQTGHVPNGQALSLGQALVRQGVLTATMLENVEKKLQAQAAGGVKQLGPYTLLKKLGEGGMGAVYLAEDTHVGRQVALKVLPKKFADNEETVSRFRREAKAAGALNHINIVCAHNVGEEQGFHYLAMEYCEGETLDKILKRDGAFSCDKALEIVRQAACGLQHAHEHGFIHRDIKPANIILCQMGKGPGVAKILDLGLSKDVRSGEQAFTTQTGLAMGTPHYMSPEQARGERNMDYGTDIYSLGATFFHLATGRTPFEGATGPAIMLKHINENPPNPRAIKETIPESVALIILKMLAKKPADRYPSCKELLADLNLAINGQMPIHALDAHKSSMRLKSPVLSKSRTKGPLPPVETGHSTWQNESIRSAAYPVPARWKPYVAAAIIALLFGGALAALWVVKTRRDREEQAAVERRKAEAEAYQAEQARAAARQKEEQQRAEAERLKAEEATRLAGEKLKASEEKLKNETAQLEEERRKLAEEKQKAEEARLAEERRKQEEARAAREAEEKKKAEAAKVAPPAEVEKADDLLVKYLSSLPEQEVRVGYGSFGKKGALGYDGKKIVVDGNASPNGLSMHAIPKSASHVAYLLNKQFSTFKAAAALNDDAQGSASPLVFKVLADGKTLWQSTPIQKFKQPQECELDITGAEKLELAVECSGENGNGHAVWVEPRVIKMDPAVAAAKAAAAKAARLRQLFVGVLKEAAPLLEQNKFAEAGALLERKAKDPALEEVAELLIRQKTDLDCIIPLRRSAIEALRKQAGAQITLKKGGTAFSGKVLLSGQQPEMVTLDLGGAQITFNAAQLSLEDVDQYGARTENTAADLWQRGTMYLAAGNISKAKECFLKAGTGEDATAAAYLDCITTLEFSNIENAAAKVWDKAEKLFLAKEMPAAKTAYEAFEHDYGKSQFAAGKGGTLKERYEAIEKALGFPPQRVLKLGPVKLETVLVKAGEFIMGADNEWTDKAEKPAHKVKITKPFYMGKYPVTVGQFKVFAEAAKYQTEGERWDNKGLGFERGRLRMLNNISWKTPNFPQDDNNPVCLVTWNDAQEFCKWAAKITGKTVRLPTEAEWEYACRAGTATKFYTGDKDNDLAMAGWWQGNAESRSHPVGMKKPNAFGLFDMHGNVWQWIQDSFDGNYYSDSPPLDPPGPNGGGARVLRGGSWSNNPVDCRAARRDRRNPATPATEIGFRVAVECTSPGNP